MGKEGIEVQYQREFIVVVRDKNGSTSNCRISPDLSQSILKKGQIPNPKLVA